MNLKKILAALLCIALLVSILTGCGNKDNGTYEYNGDGQPGNGTSPYDPGTHVDNTDFRAAFEAFSPETVMIKLGDLTVTWAELYVFLFRSVMSLVDGFGVMPDWSDTLFDDTTLAEIALDYTVEEVLAFKLFEHGARVTGVTLDDDLKEILREDLEGMTEAYGGTEAFAKALWENGGFYSLELFEQMIQTEYLIGAIMTELYGEDGELLSAEVLDEYVLKEGYLMAKHILRMKTGDGDDAPLNESNDILKLLQEYDGDDFEGFFDTLMAEHNEDVGGMMSYPDGYLFQFNDMVFAFSSACLALEPGQISGVVESEFGYHIILRLPIDFEIVPIALANSGYYRTLRQLVAVEDFDTVIEGWRDEMPVEFTDAFNTIDIAALFDS